MPATVSISALMLPGVWKSMSPASRAQPAAKCRPAGHARERKLRVRKSLERRAEEAREDGDLQPVGRKVDPRGRAPGHVHDERATGLKRPEPVAVDAAHVGADHG